MKSPTFAQGSLLHRVFRSCRRRLSAGAAPALAVWVLAAWAAGAGAQTTILSETFEGIFPADNAWMVGDSNASGGLVYWDDVASLYGTVPAHTGDWKGYCAAIGHGGTDTNPLYVTNMQAYMSKAFNLTGSGYTGANLRFWYVIPSIESSIDSLRVYVDSVRLWLTASVQTNWAYLTLPLNNYLSGSHTLRFEFDSDWSIVAEGAYLDDISIDAYTRPFAFSLLSVSNINYGGYVLASDTFLGRSNIQAQAIFSLENFTGTNTTFSNVLSFRLINTSNSTAHPLYDFGNATTNPAYSYNITNAISLLAGTNLLVTNVAYLRPAAWMNQFIEYAIECRFITNGVVAQTIVTPATNYYHFTNIVSGDVAYNVLLNLTGGAWSRTYAVNTVPGQNSFQVDATYEVRRWDDYSLGVSPTNVPIVFEYSLKDSSGNTVPLATARQSFLESIDNYAYFFIFTYPAFQTTTRTLDIVPAVQLDSVNKTYYLTVTISHTNNPASGQVIVANSKRTPLNELLHFNGKLMFGGISTTLNALGGAPPVNPPVGGAIPTTLSGAGGYVGAKPDHTYSGAGPLDVNLRTDGVAVVTAGSVTLTAPSPDSDSIAGVNFQRGPVTLSPAGAVADVRVTLPTGFGYRTNDTSSHVIFPYIQFTSVDLLPALTPSTDLTFNPGVKIYSVEESKPVWMPSDMIVWLVSDGKFNVPNPGTPPLYVQADEYAYLHSVSNLLVDPPEMGDKRSNDKYWLALVDTSTFPALRPDANANALLSVDFKFDPGGFRTHFPYDTIVEWGGAGGMRVSDDLVVQGGVSALSGAGKVGVPYSRDCPDCGGGGAGVDTPYITVSNGLFGFTRDGGLVAGGPTTSTVDLKWGYIGSPTSDFAQQAQEFREAAFHMPGMFVRGDQNRLQSAQGPTTILYTGFAVSNLNVIERPATSGYKNGFADYAGLNFRCLADGDHRAQSTIAGLTGIQWKLDARSKYYVRYGGVSGIHEAVPGSFPSSLTLWGYAFTFTSYGLSYLDSQNKDSVTDGAISLPYPSQFIQKFENMVFSCLGAPVSADVPQGDGFKVMVYWDADFKTLAIQFTTKNSCSPDKGFLVLGIEGYISHVDKPLYGNVGFFSNGDQIPPTAGLGVTSRLKFPNVIEIEGPNQSTYSFTPVQDVYYNVYKYAPPSPTPGWANIFGKIDVPFFEDLQLHLQTSCHTNGTAASNATIYLSGGWPRAGTTSDNHGWLTPDNRTPFETNLFDWNNRGWPDVGGLTIANYRDNQSGQDYHPRAQKVWLGIVPFDYPLSWNPTLRSFKSWEEVTNDLLVINVQHQVKYMDAKRAEIDFGAQYDGLPSISIANLAFNAIDEATGVGSAIVKAAAQPVEDLLSAGLDEMNQLLDAEMKNLMDGVFDRTVDPIIDKFYAKISNDWAVAWSTLPLSQRQLFIASVQTNLLNFFVGTGGAPVAENLTAVLKNVANTGLAASNLIGQIGCYLRDATNAIDAVVGVVAVGTNGQSLGSNVVGLIGKVGGDRPVVPKLMNSLVGELAPQFIDAVLGPTVSNLIAEVEPALADLTEGLSRTKQVITEAAAQLDAGKDFVNELNNTVGKYSSEITNVSVQVSLSVTQYFGQLDFTVDNPFQHLSASDVKHFIRQKVEDQFFATTAASQIQTTLRNRIYEVDAVMRQQIDSVFQQVNGMIRDLISQSLAELDNSINKCLGDVGGSIGAGKINGHACINGDSLKLLRIDAHFQFKVPDEMELNAFLEIKELDSDGSNGCMSTNAPFTEVTIGATEVPLDWISSDLKANIEAKFTFDGTVPFPVNMAGQLELVGDLSFETFVLHDLAAALAFGKYENYIALKGGVRFNGYDFSGAVFFGRTCTLDPIKLIDPDVASVLGNPPFTGGYCYAQGWLPVSEMVLGIPASCLFEISAGVGAGVFYFVEGPTYGGKMFLGVSGELLCIVSIEGDITMIGLKQGDDFRFSGHGHFEADIGPCPFCISISKDVSLKYMNKSWHID